MAILTLFRHRFYKNDGTVNAGGKVYTYVAGTTTPVATYTDSGAGTPNANPIILDSKGEADIWTNGQIKVNVLESDNTQVTGWPVDNVGSGVSNNDANARWAGTASGTADALTISPSPSITAYVVGQSFIFKAGASNNTGATTISISGLSAIAVQSNGAACAGGEILANNWYQIVLSTTAICQISKIGENVFGTGVKAALAIAVGSAGAPVVNGGALGTPSSGVTNNLTTTTTATAIVDTDFVDTNLAAGGKRKTLWTAVKTYLATTFAALAGSASQAFSASNFTTAQGLQFPATQNPSADANNLDDYEEGTWTPNQGADLVVVGAFSSTGQYTKIGRIVTISGTLSGATSIAAPSNGLLTSNIPFTAGTFLSSGNTVNASATVGTNCYVGSTNNCKTVEAIGTTTVIYFSIVYTV